MYASSKPQPRVTRMHLFVLVAMGVALAACSKSEGPTTAGTASSATAVAAREAGRRRFRSRRRDERRPAA